ncbi:sensor histidine kinase [Actinoplanes sp. NPDC051513]|uniref:sensor histidine kinase n=1 Tax=Actinoplanes sp. NPDC051513 TaxID=3363908 RepID=UPI00379CEFA3
MLAIRAVARRHPRWADAGLAAAAAALGIPGTVQAHPGVLEWLCYCLIFVPLVWRRRAPVVVFWVLFVLVEASDAAGLDLPGTVLVMPIAIYAIARYRPRRYLLPVAVAVEAALVVAWIVDDEPWSSLIPVNAILIAIALLGTNLSTRRAYLDQLEERARRLERERDQRAQLAAAAERARIAREMHDVVAHNLTVIVALADAAALTATAAPEEAADKMAMVAASGREALHEMRRMLGVLHADEPASDRDPQPGLADLDRLVGQVRAAGLRVALTQQGEPGRWGPGAGLAVYRIVQEALTNTIKHAGPAATAHVRLGYTPGGVEVEVTDDGVRRPAAPAPADAHGLTGMAERAASYGGRLDAGPLPGQGWRVHAHLPFDESGAS